MALITLLRGIGVSELCSPEMTGEWEYKLKRMAKGEMKRKEFMAEIKAFHARHRGEGEKFRRRQRRRKFHGRGSEMSEVRRRSVRRRLSHLQMSSLRFDHLENDGGPIVR